MSNLCRSLRSLKRYRQNFDRSFIPMLNCISRSTFHQSFCRSNYQIYRQATRNMSTSAEVGKTQAIQILHTTTDVTPPSQFENDESINDIMLETLPLDNSHLSLPIDPIRSNDTHQVPNAVFSLVDPTPVRNPRLVAKSLSALGLACINSEQAERPEFIEYLSGNKIIPRTQPAAHCYCGHQFGYFSGQLGE